MIVHGLMNEVRGNALFLTGKISEVLHRDRREQSNERAKDWSSIFPMMITLIIFVPPLHCCDDDDDEAIATIGNTFSLRRCYYVDI